MNIPVEVEIRDTAAKLWVLITALTVGKVASVEFAHRVASFGVRKLLRVRVAGGRWTKVPQYVVDDVMRNQSGIPAR